MHYLCFGIFIEQKEESHLFPALDISIVAHRLVLPSLPDRVSLPIASFRLYTTSSTDTDDFSFPPLPSPIDRNLPAPILFHLDPISP